MTLPVDPYRLVLCTLLGKLILEGGAFSDTGRVCLTWKSNFYKVVSAGIMVIYFITLHFKGSSGGEKSGHHLKQNVASELPDKVTDF